MQIDIIAPGRVKERYLRDAIDEYSKRLSRYCKLNIIEVADEKTPDHASEGVDRQIKAREGERIAKHLKDGGLLLPLPSMASSCPVKNWPPKSTTLDCVAPAIFSWSSAVQSALTTRFCVVLIFC